MRRSILILMSALIPISSSLSAHAADLIETADTSGGTKTFVKDAKLSGLSETLKGNGPYTVFAPDNAAFEKLPPDTKEALMKDKKKLAEVLAYHVIPGKILVADVKPGEVKTLQGTPVKLSSDNGKITVNGANVTQSDLAADNGVIHIIDTVVLPKQ